MQVNIRGADGRTALHIAVQYGHEDVTLTLLARNAEVNAMSKPNIRGTEDLRKFEAGRIPLHWAAAQGHESIVRIVLENKADVLARNATGRTALQDSIWRSHDRIAIMLLERGSAITNADNEAGTPLHEACYNGRLEVVKTLIAKGKETGDFPVMLDAITTDENRWNAFWFLRATPIFFAAITCHVDCVRYLLQCGPSNSKYGDTPLHAACVLGNLVIVQLLLDAGVDIELRDSVNTETPLLKAASTGKTEVIMYLLEQGADPMAKNPCGRNALEHARLHEPGQHPAAVELLDQWIKRCDEPKKPPQT